MQLLNKKAGMHVLSCFSALSMNKTASTNRVHCKIVSLSIIRRGRDPGQTAAYAPFLHRALASPYSLARSPADQPGRVARAVPGRCGVAPAGSPGYPPTGCFVDLAAQQTGWPPARLFGFADYFPCSKNVKSLLK